VTPAPNLCVCLIIPDRMTRLQVLLLQVLL
jgi:hypothetical protein